MAEFCNLSATLIQTGIGIQNAKRASQKAFAHTHYDLAISSGFAGALIPSSIGALVLPNSVILGNADSYEGLELSSFPCSVQYYPIASQVLESLKLQCVPDLLVTVPWIVSSASEKQAIAQKFQASALDMESAGIAAVAQERRIPFLIIRSVSDLRDETLPQDFNLFLSPSTWMQGLWRMVSLPAHWSHVYRLRQQTKVAARQLTRFFDTFFTHLRQR